jgi:hypothetical protein
MPFSIEVHCVMHFLMLTLKEEEQPAAGIGEQKNLQLTRMT